MYPPFLGGASATRVTIVIVVLVLISILILVLLLILSFVQIVVLALIVILVVLVVVLIVILHDSALLCNLKLQNQYALHFPHLCARAAKNCIFISSKKANRKEQSANIDAMESKNGIHHSMG